MQCSQQVFNYILGAARIFVYRISYGFLCVLCVSAVKYRLKGRFGTGSRSLPIAKEGLQPWQK
jgi:hypothetical protein